MVTQDPDARGLRGRIINVASVMGLVASAGGAGEFILKKKTQKKKQQQQLLKT